MTFMTVQIDDDTLLNLWIDRLNFWKENLDDENYKFLCDYLEDNIDLFEGCDIDPKYIVDNLVVNYSIITQEEVDADPDLYPNIEENCLYYRDNKYLIN